MKAIIKYSIGFFLFLYAEEISAQDIAGTKSAIPSKTTAKGRRELRKDKRVKRHTVHALKANEKKLEVESDKPFHKKGHHKASKNKEKKEVEIRKDE